MNAQTVRARPQTFAARAQKPRSHPGRFRNENRSERSPTGPYGLEDARSYGPVLVDSPRYSFANLVIQVLYHSGV